MKPPVAMSLILALGFALFLSSGDRIQRASAQSLQPVSISNQFPFAFEANLGQTDNRVKYLARGKGYTLFLTKREAVFSFARVRLGGSSTAPASAVLRTRFVGASLNPTITGMSRLSGKSNYFIGSDPAKWRVGVPGYSKVRYSSLYPGIDLIYYGHDGQLEYDLVLAPGADPHRIRFAVAGADQLSLNDQGDVVLRFGGNQIAMRRPFVYQEVAGTKHAVKTDFILLSKDEIGLQIGPYNSGKPLVVDPALVYSGYLGGSGSDGALAAAVDSHGNAYVTGGTVSTDFPRTSGVVQPTYGGTGNCKGPGDFSCGDVFVTKFNSKGSALVWSTYLGGSDKEVANTIFVDKNFNVYVAGETHSANFPVTPGAFQTSLKGSHDGFITKLNPTATALVYSTYLSGSTGKNSVAGITVDSSGNLYAAGGTQSSDFPVTAGAFQTICKPCIAGKGGNGFITKLNSTGTAPLIYSTFLGGSTEAFAAGIAVDSSGNAYVTGSTVDTDFPTKNPIQSTFGGGGISCSGSLSPCGDAFVSKLNLSGSALLYSTYLGGSGEDTGFAIKIDSTGAAYVAGGTDSSNFPTTAGAFQTTFGGGSAGCVNTGVTCGDAFVTKINSSGSSPLVFSTYLGGSGDDGVLFGLAVDSSKNVHLAGITDSSNFPVTANATQHTFGGGTSPCPIAATCGDAFRTILNSSGSSLVFSTFLGGSSDDGATGMALDAGGYAYVVGATGSTNFPITGKAFQKTCNSCLGGMPDAFVTKIGPSADLKLTNTAPGSVPSGSTLTYTIVVSNLGPDTASSLTITDNTPSGTTFNSVSITTGSCTSPAAGSSGTVQCRLGSLTAGAKVTETLVVNVTVPSGGTVTDKASVGSKTFDPITTNNSATVKTSVT